MASSLNDQTYNRLRREKLLWQHMGYFEKDIEVLREKRSELFNG